MVILKIALAFEITGFVLGLIFGSTYITLRIERIINLVVPKSFRLASRWERFLSRVSVLNFNRLAFFVLLTTLSVSMIIAGLWLRILVFVWLGLAIFFLILLLSLLNKEVRESELKIPPRTHPAIAWSKIMDYIFDMFFLVPLLLFPLVLFGILLKTVYIVSKYSGKSYIKWIIATLGSILLLTGLIIEFIVT